MGAGHGCTGDSVGRLVTGVPGGEDVESGCENVNALAVVGEVGSVVGEGGSTNGDGLLSTSGRVVAGILVVADILAKKFDANQVVYSLSSSDGEMKTGLNSSVDSIVK